MRNNDGSQTLFWSVGAVVVVLDIFTKLLAVQHLSPHPVPVLGDWVTLQLVYNPGAAFGIHVGAYSRWVFLILALVALVVLGSMVRHTKGSDYLRLMALGLVCGGAVGNLIDRIRSARGVVDFIDIGVGTHRWPTFNVADSAVTVGAILLAIVLWLDGRQADAAERRKDSSPAEASS